MKEKSRCCQHHDNINDCSSIMWQFFILGYFEDIWEWCLCVMWMLWGFSAVLYSGSGPVVAHDNTDSSHSVLCWIYVPSFPMSFNVDSVQNKYLSNNPPVTLTSVWAAALDQKPIVLHYFRCLKVTSLGEWGSYRFGRPLYDFVLQIPFQWLVLRFYLCGL